MPTSVIGHDFELLGHQYNRQILGNFIDQEMPFVRRDTTLVTIFAGGNEVNTITAATRQQLFEALAELRGRPDVRAVVLVCAGSTFFSGADIGEFAGPPKEQEYRRLWVGYN